MQKAPDTLATQGGLSLESLPAHVRTRYALAVGPEHGSL